MEKIRGRKTVALVFLALCGVVLIFLRGHTVDMSVRRSSGERTRELQSTGQGKLQDDFYGRYRDKITASASGQTNDLTHHGEYRRSVFLEKVAKNRFFELYRDQSDVPYQDEIESVLDLPSVRLPSGDDLALRSLFLGPDSILGSSHRSFSSTSEAEAFLRSLALAGMMSGAESYPRGLRAARETLEELERSHPENAAYSYFKIAVLSKMREPDSVLREEAARAFSAAGYETHYARLYSQIKDKGMNHATSWLVALIVTGKLPVPDFIEVSSVLNRLIDTGDEEFLRGAIHLGRLMMSAAEKSGSSGVWGSLEYSLGRGHYFRAWGRLHPRSKPHQIPDLKEWRAALRSRGRLDSPEPVDLSGILYDREAFCDQQLLDLCCLDQASLEQVQAKLKADAFLSEPNSRASAQKTRKPVILGRLISIGSELFPKLEI